MDREHPASILRKGANEKPPGTHAGRSVLTKQGWCLIALLVLPTFAIGQAATTLPLWIIITWVAGISLVTWFVMRGDKRCAVANGRRTPETTLHMLELLGGWPASFLAQRFHRHKIAKVSYQFVYWCIVALHQAVAADYLLGWKSVIFLRHLLD